MPEVALTSTEPFEWGLRLPVPRWASEGGQNPQNSYPPLGHGREGQDAKGPPAKDLPAPAQGESSLPEPGVRESKAGGEGKVCAGWPGASLTMTVSEPKTPSMLPVP